VRVWAPLQRDAHLRFTISDGAGLGRRHLEIGWSGVGAAAVALDVYDDRGRGQVAPTSLGSGSDITLVVAHWVNVPFMTPVARLASGTRYWLGRWTAEVNGWSLILDARFDLTDTVRQMSFEDAQFAMTHVGELARTGRWVTVF